MVSLRPKGSDDLGLRRALSDRLLPLLVAAMAFLAVLACAGAVAASGLAERWRGGAASLATVQVPQPDAAAGSTARADAVAGVLAGLPGATVRRLSPAEMAGLLQPWLGDDAARLSMLLPAVFELRSTTLPAGLQDRLQGIAPGTLLERGLVWFDRLAGLGRSLQAVAALALAVVGFVAAAVVAVAARAGLAARRDAIEIVHGLGGTDGMIAGRFARRVTWLAFAGGVLGVALALPVLLRLADLTAPFQILPRRPEPALLLPESLLQVLPLPLWAVLPAMPVLAACIGWATTQATVRLWLGRLP